MCRHLCSLLLPLALVLSSLPAALSVLFQDAPVAAETANAVHGIDVADMDLSVSPRDDFYRFANGGWLDRTSIPADRPSVDTIGQLVDRTVAQQLALLRAAAGPDGPPPGSDEAKAAAIFAQGLDMAARNRQGIEPIRDALDRIATIDSLDAYHAYLSRALFDGVTATLPLGVQPDFKDSMTNALFLVPGVPAPPTPAPHSLPNRDYYLNENPDFVAVRQAYVDTGAELLVAAGYGPDEAAAAAQAVFDFEKILAAETLTREQQQDFALLYNPMTLAELAEAYPAMDWPGYLHALGASGVDRIIVTDLGYLAALPEIMAATPVTTLRAYLELQLLRSWAGALSDDLGGTAFTFNRVLEGLEEQPPLEERVLRQVNVALRDAVGKLYVEAHFPPEAKAAIEELTQDVLAAFRERLETNAWMTPETRAKAVEKLDAVTVKVGYPDEWKTYEAVEVAASFAGSLRSAHEANLREWYASAGKPVNRAEWDDISVQEVNAAYNAFGNEIIFPAAILQPPMFDYEADPATNYGAIGYVIGHEITHGFDLGGSQFDAAGNLANWWTAEDYEQFMALNAALAAQYSAIEVAPGLFVNGQITVGENAADLGGIQNAYAALLSRLAEEGQTPGSALSARATPGTAELVEPPFTQEQRFYIAATAVWRNKTRPAFLEYYIRSDTHAPGSVRATQPLRNADAFYAAFGIQPGDPMWQPPEDRIVIW